MGGVVFTGNREVEIRTLPDLHTVLGEVVIAMKASGLRGSDLCHNLVAKAESGDPANLKIAGYEPCGVIAEIESGYGSYRRRSGRDAPAPCAASGTLRCA